jgi:Acetyltransferase (GNAT) family
MHRHRSISRLLVNEVLGWARLSKARTLQLMVTSNNEPPILFYQRLGFTRTGRTEPYPNDPVLIEYEMSLPISLAMSSSTLHTVPLCDNSDKRPSRQCLIS